MKAKYLTLTKDTRGVATVTLDRPEIHNAFDDALIAELTDCFDALDRDDGVRLVVLRGEGKSFCAGADLGWMRKMKDFSPQENLDDSYKLAGLFGRINNVTRPVLGCVHGAALGGGVGLVAVCDYVIAEEGARFGFTEVRLGMLPSVISPYVIAKIGESAARAWFLSGEMFDTATAKAMGLVHDITTADALEDALEVRIASFLKAGPEASRKAKALIANVVALSKAEVTAEKENAVLKYTVQAIANARVSPEGQEGMEALLNKRKPGWQQR